MARMEKYFCFSKWLCRIAGPRPSQQTDDKFEALCKRNL